MKLVSTAKPNNVLVRQLEERLDAMRGNIKASLDRAYAQQNVAVRELNAQMAQTEKRLGSYPVEEREFRNIYRQQSIKEALYMFLLQKREETAMLIANTIPKGVIVDEAYALNKPLGMKRKMILALAFFIGLCIPPIYWYLKKLFRTKFQTREDVEQMTDIPMLGEVCISHSVDPLVVRAAGSSSTAELFRLIRTNLQFVLNDKEDKVVLLTSTISGEGKSFIAINLAASMAMLGKKVLLIGMDIRAPKLGEYLHLSSKWGLTQYLANGNIGIDDMILKNAVADNFDVILSGPVPPNPAELLVTDAVDQLFAELRNRYDYILIDSAPVGMVSDTFTLDRISDATVYVCRANYTSFKDIEFVNNIYDQKRLKKIGLVVNGTSARKGYGYGYGHTSDKDKPGK
jgi:capsular exopolysaccharide synthesis family protein